MAEWHVCEECAGLSIEHPAECDCGCEQYYFPAVCCPGCPCGSFETAHAWQELDPEVRDG